MLKALREQASDALMSVPARRRPALRRSDAPGALLATDLPLVSEEAAVAAFTEQMQALGWRVFRAENGWLLLDAPVPVPAALPPDRPEGEYACCISLLQRHPDACDASAQIRALVKAAEAGAQPFTRLCAQLHADFAARLRRHELLPGALLPYLYQAYHDLYDRRKQP